MANVMITRLTAFDRLVHLGTAASFVYAFLSGIGIAFPKMHWLLTVLGGGEFARWLHPWAGVVFSVFGLLMILAYIKDMFFDTDDIKWMVGIVHYMTNHEEKLPETRKYNAGQKMYFWITVFWGTIIFLVSGLAMWFPDAFAAQVAPWVPGMGVRDLVLLATVVHEVMFIAAGAFFIVHIYMGTLGMPGTLSALATGKVTADWAKAHHPKWYREMVRKA